MMFEPQGTVNGRVLQLAQQIADRYDRLVGSLQVASASYGALLDPVFGDGPLGPFDAGTLRRIRELAEAVLETHPEAYGSGLIVDADRVAVSDQTILWQVRTESGFAPYGFNFDDRSTEFYDFRELPWDTVPRDQQRPALTGPYLDFLGVDEYIVTVTVPCEIGGVFGGTAAADLEVREIERRFLGLVSGIDGPIALTNAEGRIICANSARFLPGEFAPADTAVAVPTKHPMLGLAVGNS